jgi:hypothetical protein
MYLYFMSKLEYYCDTIPTNAESCNPRTVTEAFIARQWPGITCFHDNKEVHESQKRHFQISPQQTNIKQYTKPDIRATEERTHR